MNKILLIAVLLSTSCQACLADVSPATTPKRSAKADSADNTKIRDWFKQYDQIRREAEMTRAEKFSISPTLKKGISITSNESERQRAKDMASRMVSRYGEASGKLAKLT